MNLPDFLKNAIQEELQGTPPSQLARYATELSDRYRSGKGPFLTDKGHFAAYLLTRLPGTYAALQHVLSEFKKIADPSIQTFADIGSGPGTAIWALYEQFPMMQKGISFERDKQFVSISRSLYQKIAPPFSLEWMQTDVDSRWALPPQDLIVASYLIGECTPAVRKVLINNLWQASKSFLILIEPGTPAGFQRIKEAREDLILAGGKVVAPCPHSGACPNDWCHFAERLNRSSEHRVLKDATLNYEDEKFSYVVMAKTLFATPGERIIRHPQIRPGHISFTICSNDGIKNRIISKKEKQIYKNAKKLNWGDSI